MHCMLKLQLKLYYITTNTFPFEIYIPKANIQMMIPCQQQVKFGRYQWKTNLEFCQIASTTFKSKE